MILDVIQRAEREIRAELPGFDPALVSAEYGARVFEAVTSIERSVVALKTLVAARAADAGDWKREGHRSPADWAAQKCGSSLGENFALFETSERLGALPGTTEALRRGELSGPQVREIASAAAEDPRVEDELLRAAAWTRSLKGLKDEVRRVKARTAGEADARARYEQIRKSRYLRMWTDHDGAGRIEARVTPDDLARMIAVIGQESNAVFTEARKAGRRESTAAYDADALVALVTGAHSERTGRPTTMMHLRVDLPALRRGHLEDGESCEIPGVGPVPLATAVSLIGEAILKVIITDGVDVTTICHLGRAIPAPIRSALEDRDPTCVVPGCDVARGLQIDHYQIDYAQDGPTELWNLCRLCRWHHYLKTSCGYAITGQPGSWEWGASAADGNPILTS